MGRQIDVAKLHSQRLDIQSDRIEILSERVDLLVKRLDRAESELRLANNTIAQLETDKSLMEHQIRTLQGKSHA